MNDIKQEKAEPKETDKKLSVRSEEKKRRIVRRPCRLISNMAEKNIKKMAGIQPSVYNAT